MQQIKVRVQASKESLQMAVKRKDRATNYLHAEFCYLQIRRITEILALAVVIAHNQEQDFRSKSLTGEWNADRVFGALEKLNDHGFPKAMKLNPLEKGKPPDFEVKHSGYLTRTELMKIYYKCNEMLHAGSLKDAIKKPKLYDLGEISRWSNQIIKLLDRHIILLPEMKMTLLVQMEGPRAGYPDCAMSELVAEMPV